jgi:hypothetical protein
MDGVNELRQFSSLRIRFISQNILLDSLSEPIHYLVNRKAIAILRARQKSFRALQNFSLESGFR